MDKTACIVCGKMMGNSTHKNKDGFDCHMKCDPDANGGKSIVTKSEIVKTKFGKFKKEALLIEDHHPAIGRIMIVDGKKFRVLDEPFIGSIGQGTFIKPFTQEDQERIDEYDEAINELSEMLISKVDIKRMIKENIKDKPLQDLKTGIFILKKEKDGEKVETEHHKGCYHFKLHYGNVSFDFATGSDCGPINNFNIR